LGLVRSHGGKYQVDFYLGQYRFRKNLETEAEARGLLQLVESKLPNKDCLLEKAANLYLANVSSRKSKKSRDIDNHVLRRIALEMAASGEEEPFVSAVKPHHLESLRTALSSEGIANTTINRYFNTAKHFFKKCEEWDFIQKSPAKFLKLLSNDAIRRESWSEEEVEVVRNFFRENERNVFDFIFLTGCRLSQAIELRVSDVDLANRVVTFRSKKGPEAKEKHYPFPMSESLLCLVLPFRKDKSPDDYIFLSTQGKPYKAALFSKNFRRMLARNKLDAGHLTLHGLRHMFASRLSRIGAPLNDIRVLLGHSTTKVTEGYIHANVDDLRRYIE
jgi:integrase